MADVIVLVIIGVCLACSVGYSIRNKKRGGSSCGCGCSGCGGASCCGKEKNGPV
ncbi:MAG: FeoB-associated Cys-rich membrane protein [Lachnospiraceae bacterium]|nr:FeoB-associated Cys-rich membrane protein [Lachnospiraceae bacterium]